MTAPTGRLAADGPAVGPRAAPRHGVPHPGVTFAPVLPAPAQPSSVQPAPVLPDPVLPDPARPPSAQPAPALPDAVRPVAPTGARPVTVSGSAPAPVSVVALTCGATPRIVAGAPAPSDTTHLPDVVVTPDPDRPGRWHVTVTLPPEVHEAEDGALDGPVAGNRRTLAARPPGPLAQGDQSAEVLSRELCLLRAELDLLKRAFRRHCIETG